MTTQSGPPAAQAGVIHDIGYRHYEGPRLGRAAIIRALGWHSLRSAFGIGRGAKAKIIPVIAFVLMCLPAVVNAISLATHGGQAVEYDTYVFQLRVLIMIIFIAAQAPELVSRDLRSHVLPLYFSRPLHRLDYPLAKLGAFILACLALLEIPLLLLYLGSISQAHGGGAIWDQTRALIPGLLVGLAWAVLLASIGLALASLSGRRAYATGSIAICFFLSWALAGLLRGVTAAGGAGTAGAGARLSGLVSPFTVLDGLRQWLGGTSPGPLPRPGDLGPVYGVMFVLMLAAAVGGLAVRYRKAGIS
ncbi:MAG: type transport system permease protein [Streptosporangiaceae bacterium]|nr:type transport system permease protein [Streptosporangiaceae bacterium]